MVDIATIELPCQQTLESVVKAKFIELLKHNGLVNGQDKDGTFEHRDIQNMWVACRQGAATTFEVVGERLKFQAEQNELLIAKIEQMKTKYEPDEKPADNS